MRRRLGNRLVEVLIDPEKDVWEEKIFLEINKGEIFRFRDDWYNDTSTDQIGFKSLSNAYFDKEGFPAIDCCNQFKIST